MSSGKVLDKKSEKISGSNILRKKTNEASKRGLNESKRPLVPKETRKSEGAENKSSLGAKLFAFWQNGSEQINSGNKVNNVANNSQHVKPTKKLSSALPSLDEDAERRWIFLIQLLNSGYFPSFAFTLSPFFIVFSIIVILLDYCFKLGSYFCG